MYLVGSARSWCEGMSVIGLEKEEERWFIPAMIAHLYETIGSVIWHRKAPKQKQKTEMIVRKEV